MNCLETLKGGLFTMDFNTILMRFGLNPDDFENRYLEPIQVFNGSIYSVNQADKERKCPFCKSKDVIIKGYYHTETKCSQTDHYTDTLQIRRIRYKCKRCHKSYSPPIRGIERGFRVTNQVRAFVNNDFTRAMSFKQIGEKYNLSTARVLQMFDTNIPIVYKLPMPKILCIDEIRFVSEGGIKYCCVLYDFFEKKIVDIIKSRQLPYLKEYFSNLSKEERDNVEVFISDMYDGYATVKDLYFKNATHVVDNFHVITQMTRAVNSLRIRTMNGYTYKGDTLYNFMKSKWQLFLCREEHIPDKYIVRKDTGETHHCDELVYSCIKLDNDFWEGYLTLQDLFHHSYYSTFDESLKFVEYISNKLRKSNSELLQKVGDTYYKWRVEIANAFTRQVKGIKYTNAIAECINNKLKTILKSAYGYHNFERFRKRALLICTYTPFR